MKLKLSQIIDPENRCRKFFDPAEMEFLEFSLKRHGQLQPIVVRKAEGDKYELIDGGRRLRAHRNLDMQTIEAILQEDCDDVQAKEIELELNLARQDLNWKEKALGYKQLYELKERRFLAQPMPGMSRYTQADFAAECDISTATVSIDLDLARGLEEFPELAKEETRNAARRKLRKLRRGIGDDPQMERFKECFVNHPLDYALSLVHHGSVDLLVLDLQAEFFPTARWVDLVSKQGQGIIFCRLGDVPGLVRELQALDMYVSDEANIWNVKGKGVYYPFIWFSPSFANPPECAGRSVYYPQDDVCYHPLAKPKGFIGDLIKSCTKAKGFVFEPNCYGAATINMAWALQRGVLCNCTDRRLWEQVCIGQEHA